MNVSARHALNRELLGVIGTNDDAVRASDDLDHVHNAAAPLAARLTVHEYAQSLTATPLTCHKRVKELRVAVEKAYVSVFGRDEARLNTAFQKREKLPRARVASLVHTYEAPKLEQLRSVFARFA